MGRKKSKAVDTFVVGKCGLVSLVIFVGSRYWLRETARDELGLEIFSLHRLMDDKEQLRSSFILNETVSVTESDLLRTSLHSSLVAKRRVKIEQRKNVLWKR